MHDFHYFIIIKSPFHPPLQANQGTHRGRPALGAPDVTEAFQAVNLLRGDANLSWVFKP